MKKSSREKLNLFFSAFLVLGFIICAYFFMELTSTMANHTLASVINIAVAILFGLIVFYATRVGEGKPVKRFSPIVLCVLVVPTLFVIVASLAEAFPLHEEIAKHSEVIMLAGVAFGYGVPYTFLSGFELIEEVEEVDEIVEGGLAQELAQTEDEEAEVEVEDVTEEDVAELEALDGADEKETEE